MRKTDLYITRKKIDIELALSVCGMMCFKAKILVP